MSSNTLIDSDTDDALKKNDSGEKLETDKWQVVKGYASEIAETWKSIAPTLNGPRDDSTKIVVTQENFEKVLADYLSLPEAAAYLDELRAYVTSTNARNTKVAELDGLRGEIAQLESQSTQLEADIANVWSLSQSSLNPGLIEYKNFMSTVYKQTKWNLIKLLYEERRAWEYWALKRMSFVVVGQDVAALQAIHQGIVSSEVSVRKERGQPSQERQKVPLVIRTTSTENGKEIVLRTGFAAFKNRNSANFGKLTFFIPPSHPSFNYDEPAITVRQVDVQIPGVKTDDNQISIRLIHGGVSTIKSPRRETITFSHEIRKTDIGYPLAGNTGPVTVTRFANEDEYVYLSPFATWTLILDPTTNPGLDLEPSRTSESFVRHIFS